MDREHKAIKKAVPPHAARYRQMNGGGPLLSSPRNCLSRNDQPL